MVRVQYSIRSTPTPARTRRYLRGDSLLVADQGTGRYEVFTLAGEPAASRQIPPCASGPGPPALGTDGTQVRATLGFDGVLAVVCSPEGEERLRIGELLALDSGRMTRPPPLSPASKPPAAPPAPP